MSKDLDSLIGFRKSFKGKIGGKGKVTSEGMKELEKWPKKEDLLYVA